MQKHQNEVISDNIKGKLFTVVEMYYRYSLSVSVVNNDQHDNKIDVQKITDITSALLSTYLQLPEGKLLNSKDKRKVLTWLQSYNNNIDHTDINGVVTGSSRSVRNVWSVEEIHDDHTVTLLHKDNNELWKEDYVITNIQQHFDQLNEMLNNEHTKGGTVYIELDEVNNEIIRIVS